jgi:hypothetical protein
MFNRLFGSNQAQAAHFPATRWRWRADTGRSAVIVRAEEIRGRNNRRHSYPAQSCAESPTIRSPGLRQRVITLDRRHPHVSEDPST